jgi:hypothetical protein
MEVKMELDFEIDKITESIENTETGEVLSTLVLPVGAADLKNVTKKAGWLCDWKFEFTQPDRKVYKLVTGKDPEIIHGLVSFRKDKGFMFMHLIDSAPFNRGKDKKYLGVAFNLIAYVCKVSKGFGFGGVVSFEPKTALIPYYEETLGAVRISGNRMAVLEDRAEFLINKYFPETEEIS